MPTSNTFAHLRIPPSCRASSLMARLPVLRHLIDLYLGFMILHFSLRLLTGETIFITIVVNNLLFWFLLPAFGLLPLLIWRRAWWRALLAGLLVGTSVLLYGGTFIPKPGPEVPPGSITFTVLAFNTANDFTASDDLIHLLRDSGAQVIALAELSPTNAAALEHALLDEYPYRVLHGEIVDGRGLLSQVPIEDATFFDVGSGRPQLEARLNMYGQSIMVYAIHLPALDYRLLEVRSHLIVPATQALLDRAAQSGLPTLLMGDFNFVDQSETYRMIRDAGYADSFRAVGNGLGRTYPTLFQYYPAIPLPLMVRIDYIWETPEFIPLASHTGQLGDSDHIPLVTQFALPPVETTP